MGSNFGVRAALRRTGLRWPKRQSLFATFIENLSNFEARRSTIGAPIRVRKFYLKLMGIAAPEELWVGPGLFIQQKGKLRLGKRICIGGDCHVMNFCPIVIGDDFLAAESLTINTASHDPVTLAPLEQLVHIGIRVWIGARVTILGGVTIGDDVVIGAGSVVTRDIPSNSIAVGVPAKVIKLLNRPAGQKLYSAWPEGNS